MVQQDSGPAGHAVLRAVAARIRAGSRPGHRQDGLRLALAIEGGGMRGTFSAGMALALHEAGADQAFDAVYGSSAGAITGAWLLSGTPQSLTGWAEPAYAKAMIRLSNPWRGRPLVDVLNLVEDLYVHVARMDFAAILANPIEFHPLATDVQTGASTDLRPLLTGPAELRLALRASAALPVLAGPPVELAGRRFYDAGLAESVPFRSALTQGATHVMVLRSRAVPGQTGPSRAGSASKPSRGARLVAATALRSYPDVLRQTFVDRGSRSAQDDALLDDYGVSGLRPAAAQDATPPAGLPGRAVLSVRPAAGSPKVGRLTRDGKLLQAAMEAGREALHAALRPMLDAPAAPPAGVPAATD
ncbi:patatin-like phospholipase family protein [Streptomyces sp. H10-C2]|uniref:patatin-like phospholipase family protein n=1 Tax=unclassified Streptomyces TaxID=2593676 RepID=UPI0024BBBE36|nr:MULTISPECIES: patatin-like phospholipase family protein [unclassified Streptomyces]MDJ0347299.1 patatin-like phospholipase family protein [Streptomyces sp. PH10-H1]MDJ0375533.1 patatin-like phospholipase family protein [Streptomyces sp. H10-C2]